MAIKAFWTIAYRDLIRNRRRSLLTLVAVGLGMVVVLFMSGLLSGMISNSLADSIHLRTGHLQLRAESYEIEKMSLLSKDLISDSDQLAAKATALSEVQSATPVLWTNGILSTVRESLGLQVTGIDPTAAFYAPIRDGMVAGSYLNPDSRNEILLGQRLANEMKISVGDRVSLTIGNADGEPQEAIFTVAGLFATGMPGYDQSTIFIPLSRLQAITGVGNRASSVIIMLHNRDDVAKVVNALQTPGIKSLTWEDLNSALLEVAKTGASFYYLIYIIVILVVAVLIANTLLMSVFERTREIGILTALGMKGRQIMLMFLLEASALAWAGIAVGVMFGYAVVAYIAKVGIPIGDDTAALAGQTFALRSKMYTEFDPGQAVILSLLMFGIVAFVSLYPAWFAARLEPVEALHTLN